MKTVFDIGDSNEWGDGGSLLLEIGRDYCYYAFWESTTHSIKKLAFVSFNETAAEESISQLLPGLPSTFSSVIFCSAFPQALLTPAKFFNDNYELLDTVYNLPGQTYKHDRIADWQMVNMYAIPFSIQKQVENFFPSVQYLHMYTPWLKVYNGYVADNQLSVHFTPQYFSVMLKKDAALHLMQTYFYSTPLDVIYYLLKICEEFELEQSSVYIILSGLVEKDSNLFRQLEQYFTNVHFAHPPEIKLPGNDYPHYFFTSLYNLATCVSSVEV